MKMHQKMLLAGILSFSIMLWLSCKSVNNMPSGPSNCTYGATLDSAYHYIDSAIAQQWIQHYINFLDSVNDKKVKITAAILPHPQESFKRSYIDRVLDVNGCIGERVFMGINDADKMVFIIGGIDACGNTLYIAETNNEREHAKSKSGDNGGKKFKPLYIKTDKKESGKGLVEMGQYP